MDSQATHHHPLRLFLIALALGMLSVVSDFAGTVTGTVKLTGTPPAAEIMPVSLDNDACGTEKHITNVRTGPGGGVQWAAAWISSLHGATASHEPPQMDQKTCEFHPQVVIARPGEEMAIMNSDGVLHNVHTYSKKNTSMNRAQPGFIKTMPVKFPEAEIIEVRCDVHSWMHGWIVVTDSPYAIVTDEKGSFSLEGVPAGTYQLTAWHGTLGEQTKEITVRDGEDTEVTFEFSGS